MRHGGLRYVHECHDEYGHRDTLFEPVNVLPSKNQNRVERGDLLFNGSSETPEEVALCSLVSHDVRNLYLNSICFGFRLRKEAEVDALFLAYSTGITLYQANLRTYQLLRYGVPVQTVAGQAHETV